MMGRIPKDGDLLPDVMQETDFPPHAPRRAPLRYLPGLDGLRAVSVLAVLIYHHYLAELWGTSLSDDPPRWMLGGFMGVEVFFVISGYLITALLLGERRRSGTVSLKRFWLRRARRLLPALFLMLAVVTLVSLLFYYDQAVEVLKGDVLAALTYTSNWWQIIAERSYFNDTAFLKHLWSLAIEEQFYLLWPPILLFGLRRVGRNRMLAFMLATALLSTVLLAASRGSNPLSDPSGAYYATWNRLSGLLLGAALAFVWAPYKIRGRTGRGARLVLDGAGLLGVYVLWWSFRNMEFTDVSTFRGGFLLVDVATLFVIAAVAHPVSDWGRWLGVTPLRWIGQRSYGIYLWHYPIFSITRPHGLDNTWWPWLTLIVRFAATIGIAELSFRFVETPIRNGVIGSYVGRLREAHGPPRRRLVTRGLVVALTVSLAGVGLGATLANAQPGQEEIHGSENFDSDQAGDEVDPEAIARLTSTTTTTVPTTTTTVPVTETTATTVAPDPNVTAPTTTTVPATTPPPTPALVQPGVLAVGDSVMLGAKSELEALGITVDAVKSRQFAHAIPVFEAYRDYGALPPTVVVHLGTNGRWVGPEFDHMMEVIGPDRRVFFLTARMPRDWEAEVNSKLADGVSRHPNATLIDWRQYSGCHDDWFGSDGIHVTNTGADNYANFILAHVNGQGASLTYCA